MAGTSRKHGDAVDHAARHIGSFADLGASTWNLRSISVELYRHALLGDAQACHPLIARIDDPSIQHDVIGVVAALQIVWVAADVHRIAAYNNHKVQLGYVPFFLHPFVRTDSSLGYRPPAPETAAMAAEATMH